MSLPINATISAPGAVGRHSILLDSPEKGPYPPYIRKPDALVVNNQWVAGTQLDEACTQIFGGPSLDVTATGDLTFEAPTITLVNGFSVKAGGEFTARN